MQKFMEKKFIVEMTYCPRFDIVVPMSTCRDNKCKYSFPDDYCDYITGGYFYRDKFFNYHRKGDI